MKRLIKKLINKCGYAVVRWKAPTPPPPIPDGELYKPLFSPWLSLKPFVDYYKIASPRTLVSPDRCYVLYILLKQAIGLGGDVWECGVYKGGTAAMFAAILKDHASSMRLHIFDTFEGMPETHPSKDWHKKGDFSDTDVEEVSRYVGFPEQVVIHKGFIPDTFKGMEGAKISFVHIDVDIYQSIIDCLDFVWPRLAVGGFIVFDDYGFPTCPGARSAVDEFFTGKSAVPLCLPTGQAVVFKSGSSNT